jgi:hypothetical protein
MGFTHYWTAAPISAARWANVAADMHRLFAACKGGLAHEYNTPKIPPLADAETIVFNGLEALGHETFWINRDSSEWSFCKTAQKPYDVPVTAVLIYLAALHGYTVESDGTREDWQAGLELARLVWPERADRFAIPSTIED